DPPAAPPALRPPARSAQPAGELVLGPYGLAIRGEPPAEPAGNLRALRSRPAARPLLFAARAAALLGVDLGGPRCTLLSGRPGGRLGGDWRHRRRRAVRAKFAAVRRGLPDDLLLARYLGCQLAGPHVGLPHFRDGRKQPKQLA